MFPFEPAADAELRTFEDTIRRFVEREIAPLEIDLRRTGATGLTTEQRAMLQAKAKRSGLWCLATPAEFGGAGLAPTQMVAVIEQAVRHTYSLPDPGDGAFGYDPPVFLLEANDEQRATYLLPSVAEGRQWFVAITEPSGGSDPNRSILTTARKTAGGWALNGRKMFISRVADAQDGVVLARSEDGGISAFIVPVDSAGLSYRPVAVIRDHETYELLLEDVVVPEENLLGELGEGFALAKKWLARGRLSLAARCIGVAQLALEMSVDYAKERQTFGKPLSERQGIQWMLADSAVELHAARLIVRDAAATLERDRTDTVKTSIAKLVATETAFQVVDRAIQVYGGMGLCQEMPLEHWFRALRVNRVVEGATEVQKHIVARHLFASA
ncbi:MAG: acyl-CoA dehydrogenase [Nocardioidaceae bacterium]|nr:acyl-CoA dehydrogenase [Nocardioidaceae bacterium]